MQLHGELDPQASRVEADLSAPRKRRSSASRKVTVRLTEELYDRLEVATDRRGVGKSMIVEAALERFLNPTTSVEELVRERFEDMHARFDRLERDMRMMAETVALHARYHLAVMPPLPQPQLQSACKLGDERFKVLAEQVDQRVRLGQPLMQGTIDRQNRTDRGGLEPPISEHRPRDPAPAHNNQKPFPERIDIEHASSAAAEEGGSQLVAR